MTTNLSCWLAQGYAVELHLDKKPETSLDYIKVQQVGEDVEFSIVGCYFGASGNLITLDEYKSLSPLKNNGTLTKTDLFNHLEYLSDNDFLDTFEYQEDCYISNAYYLLHKYESDKWTMLVDITFPNLEPNYD